MTEELIPSEHAMIVWAEDSNGMIVKAAVCDHRLAQREAPWSQHKAIAADQSYPKSLGACCTGWMDMAYDPRPTNCPEGLFMEFALKGFASSDAFFEAIDAFATMSTCGWARDVRDHPEYWELYVERRLRDAA